jgi:DNA-binding transcriptional LysR family regulator
MLDLNDLYYFHAVAAHKGFSAAARATGIPKASLSKRVALLEERLGVRLLERSTRSLRLTQVGSTVLEQVAVMLSGAEAAEAAAAQAQAEPNGVVRVGCPQGLIQDLVIDLLPVFLQRYPKVRIQLKVINRRADLVEDMVDVALRARTKLDSDPGLIMRKLGRSSGILVASPKLLEQHHHDISIDRLQDWPFLSQFEERGEVTWDLLGPNNELRQIVHTPRLMCTSFDVLRTSAIAGIGLTLLPDFIAAAAIKTGQLVHVLPDWYTPHGIIHAVFSSKKGLVPAVRVWIDFLATEVPKRVSPVVS